MMARVRLLVCVVLLLACGGVGIERACTLIGCLGFLRVDFDTAPSVPFHVTALSVSYGEADFDCADVSTCGPVVFENYTPDQLILTVSTAAGNRQFNLTPAYTPVYANGPDCGVTCRKATITAGMP